MNKILRNTLTLTACALTVVVSNVQAQNYSKAAGQAVECVKTIITYKKTQNKSHYPLNVFKSDFTPRGATALAKSHFGTLIETQFVKLLQPNSNKYEMATNRQKAKALFNLLGELKKLKPGELVTAEDKKYVQDQLSKLYTVLYNKLEAQTEKGGQNKKPKPQLSKKKNNNKWSLKNILWRKNK